MIVSVIIPTYRHRDFVRAAIESALAQDLGERSIEVIVVNDGSPDDTADVLAPLVQGGRVRYIEQANRGQAAARNRGIVEARGRYVALLDDDDVWPAGKLSRQVALLDAAPDAVLVYGPHRLLADDGVSSEADPNQWPHSPADDAYRAFRRQCWILSPGQTLIRRDALDRAGGFDERIWGSDDWDLYIRLSRLGRFLYDPQPALYYRRHAGNASASALRHARNHLAVVRRHIGLLNLPLLVSHQRQAARYFLPRLLAYAEQMRQRRQFGESLRAQCCALAFRPSLLAQPRWLRPLAANLLRRAPRRETPDPGRFAG
jgi:glycosyltransferase involved in cell wall biosynthesis